MQAAGIFSSLDEDPLHSTVRIAHGLMAGRGLLLATEPNIAETLPSSVTVEPSTVTEGACRPSPCCENRSARWEAHHDCGDL